MFTVHVIPGIDTGIVTKFSQDQKVATVVFTGLWRKPAFELKVTNEAIDPALVFHGILVHSVALVAFQRTCDEIAETRQEVDAHAGVEMLSVGTADGEKADLCAIT